MSSAAIESPDGKPALVDELLERVGSLLELLDVGSGLGIRGDRLRHLLGVRALRLLELAELDRRCRGDRRAASQSAFAARGLGASET